MARKSNHDAERRHAARKAAKSLRRSRRNNVGRDKARYLGRTR